MILYNFKLRKFNWVPATRRRRSKPQPIREDKKLASIEKNDMTTIGHILNYGKRKLCFVFKEGMQDKGNWKQDPEADIWAQGR